MEKTGKRRAETRAGLQEDLLKGCVRHLHPEEGSGPGARLAPTQRGEQLNFAEHPEAPAGPEGPRQAARPKDLPTGLVKEGHACKRAKSLLSCQLTANLPQGCGPK